MCRNIAFFASYEEVFRTLKIITEVIGIDFRFESSSEELRCNRSENLPEFTHKLAVQCTGKIFLT